MPCFSVAVEDGQPAQEPFMLRKTTPSLKPWKVMSPPSCATAGRTRVSSRSLMVLTDGLSLHQRTRRLSVTALGFIARQHGRAGQIVVHDIAEDGGLQLLPFAVALRDTVMKSWPRNTPDTP